MIQADTHNHTCFSHGKNTPFEMHAAATAKGLKIIGFSEHSPRPAGFDYSNEYRDCLNSHLNDYVGQVRALQKNANNSDSACHVLFGMEMDWLDGQEEFASKACRMFDFDYLIGSVHFLEHWGFDDKMSDWENLSQEECEKFYTDYFNAWERMISSGLFQIAAHPDLIKIFSIGQFHVWLSKPRAMNLISKGLKALREQGMAMEISSAGLRKACGEFYPAPAIVAEAARLAIPVALASDAHCVEDVAGSFADLAGYARAFGYDRQAVFNKGKMELLPF